MQSGIYKEYKKQILMNFNQQKIHIYLTLYKITIQSFYFKRIIHIMKDFFFYMWNFISLYFVGKELIIL